MALLSRLFSSKKNNKPHCGANTEQNERSNRMSFTFEKDQVRVLLFRECDWRGKKLLFDSKAVQKVPLENSSKLRFTSRPKADAKCRKEAFVEVTNGYGYQYTKPSSDAKLLEEMMFGSVAMTFRGTTLKVHSMTTPNSIMFTKVFPSPMVTHTNRRTSDRSLEDSYGSSVNSMNEYCSQNSGSDSLLASGPLDVPMGEIAVSKVPRYHSLEGDSGFCGDFSLQSVSSIGSPSYWTPVASPEARSSFGSFCGNKHSGGSLSSLQRRWIRNMSTSLELGVGPTDDMPSCNPQHRRTKLGLAVIITLTEERLGEMELFLFEHMSIIETMIERLRFTVEKAYLRKETFVHTMHDGWADIQQSLCDMLCSQRLQCPIWLTLTSSESKNHSNVASGFLQDLCVLITTLDTKATNFFVSTLVTGILTHHLGWVNTVWPANSQPSSGSDMGNSTDSLNNLLKSHPYNPLWAQLSDLYGTLGSPMKIAKTIITTNGRKIDCVNKLLSCMTYFIRCGEVKERIINFKQSDDDQFNVLTEHFSKSDSNESLKPVILEQFSKSKSKCKKPYDNNDIKNITHKSESKVAIPEIQLSSVGSGTFFVSWDDGNDSINRQDLSSCTLLADGTSIADKPMDVNIQNNTSNSCESEQPPMSTSVCPSNSEIINACGTLKSNEQDWLKTMHLQSDIIVQNDVPSPCFSVSLNSSDTEVCCPTVADKQFVKESKKESPDSKHVQVSPIDSCFPDPCSSSFEGVGARKRMEGKPELLSLDVEQFKEGEFSAEALQRGNFASPAGAEWEHKDYPTSPSSGSRASEECETPAIGGNAGGTLTSSRTFPSESTGHEIWGRTDVEKPSCSSWCGASEDGSRFAVSDPDDGDGRPKTPGEVSGEHPLCGYNEQRNVLDDGNVVNEGDVGVRKEHLHRKNASHSFRSVKGLSRCATQLSNLKDLVMDDGNSTCSSLYPNIDELAKMENVQLNLEPLSVGNSTFHCCGTGIEGSQGPDRYGVSEDTGTCGAKMSELISEKVSKLCRIPTSAVMFHLEQAGDGGQCKTVVSGESFEMKRLDAERQTAAVADSFHLPHSSVNSTRQSNEHLDIKENSLESEVVFVLGDNEELKGLNKHCSLTSNFSLNSVVSNVAGCEISSKASAATGLHFKEGVEPRESCQDVCSIIVNEPRIVMTKSSSIELENELGVLKAGEDDRTSKCVVSPGVDTGNVIPRSFSVSLPVLKHKRSKRSTKILRRHTEKYCDRCKTILKLKCDKGSMPLGPQCGQQPAFTSCEKCYCYLQNSANLDRLQAYDTDLCHLNSASLKYASRSHDHVDLCLRDKEFADNSGEELESSLEPETECMREDNAIFEQYDPSDEEILGPQTEMKEPKFEVPKELKFSDLNVTELPLPRCECVRERGGTAGGLAASLLGGVTGRYIPDLALQGCSALPPGWEAGLRRDLALLAKLPLLGGLEASEAVCVVANTHTWEVQLVSSHAYVVDKPGTFGVCVGMSQLVANMLESLVHMWRLKMPPEHCLLHLESKLRELHLRSQALAELLLTTDFCSVQLLTSALGLEANDVPLLLAVASTHSPHVANRYGLSFC